MSHVSYEWVMVHMTVRLGLLTTHALPPRLMCHVWHYLTFLQRVQRAVGITSRLLTTHVLYVTWLIHMWHDSFYGTWLIHMGHDSFTYVACVTIYNSRWTCDMTLTGGNGQLESRHVWMSHGTYERATSSPQHSRFTCDMTLMGGNGHLESCHM